MFLSINLVNASDYLKIISRAEWGADEQYRYWDSTYWSDIFTKRAKEGAVWDKKWAGFSQIKKNSIIAENKKKSDKTKLMNNYLNNNFFYDIQTLSYNRYDGTNKLTWTISKTDSIKNIVIHHTAAEYKDSYTGIKKIYKYHSLSNQWGDIGYHYVIGYNGEIFEGRAGGDYAVGAHDTWNNYSTIGIALMGDYNKRKLSDLQYTSLKKLISFLTKKYGIDLNTKIPYHKECFGDNCPHGLETHYYYPIVGHKDGKATSCPGEDLYHNTIPRLLKELQPETEGYTSITYTQTQKQKTAYKETLQKLNWEKVRTNFNKLSSKQKILLQSKIIKLVSYEIGWEKKILYQMVLDEIRSV